MVTGSVVFWTLLGTFALYMIVGVMRRSKQERDALELEHAFERYRRAREAVPSYGRERFARTEDQKERAA